MTATRTKRILSVQPVSDGGGSEHALIGMIRQLGANGWECHVAVPGPARLASEYGAAGAILHVIPMRHLTTSGGAGRWAGFAAGWLPAVARLARLARRLDVDVVHSNSLHTWYGWAAARRVRRPHVWHAREIVFQSAAALRVERFLTRHFADRVIAVSAAVGAQLDPANVVVIVDDPSPDRFTPARAGSFRAGVDLSDAEVVIGSVARVDTWKGHDVLLDAFPAVAAARPGVRLVVAGAPVPGKEGYYESLRSRAAMMPGVLWLGARDDVPDLMADLDLFVQVSTEPEPFGLVVVEALTSGVPVVAGAAGGPLEVLGAGAVGRATAQGRLVAPGDAGALAAAILEVLPDGPSSVTGRRARPRLREGEPGRFSALFDQVAGCGP
ncbi:MAG TPA: glycosyltransferase family 4 protein [Acidimicrobiales bacterium]|nr:glycosyltransferase family 4 protein [Acidimicrobiales bacterium]